MLPGDGDPGTLCAIAGTRQPPDTPGMEVRS
jgi:hypothetical protein